MQRETLLRKRPGHEIVILVHTCISPLCERSEAIQTATAEGSWIASPRSQ